MRFLKTGTFEEFVAHEHKKRVAHFCDYCASTNSAPTLKEAVNIFGFCERDAKPIVEDAIQTMGSL